MWSEGQRQRGLESRDCNVLHFRCHARNLQASAIHEFRLRLMPTSEDVRRLALALPESYEDTHRRRPAFRVNKRIFAMLGVERPAASPGFFAPLSGKRPVASLTVDREDQLNFAAAYPEAFEPAGSHGFSYIWLDVIEPGLLALLIRMSWTKAAPKRLTLSPSD